MVVISSNPNANDAFNNLFESTSKVIDDYIPFYEKSLTRNIKEDLNPGYLKVS